MEITPVSVHTPCSAAILTLVIRGKKTFLYILSCKNMNKINKTQCLLVLCKSNVT